MKAVQLNKNDNVGIALTNLSPGDEALGVSVRQPIPAGFKVALQDFEISRPVIRYGSKIGFTTKQIEAGSLVSNCLNAQIGADRLLLTGITQEAEKLSMGVCKPEWCQH